MLLQLIFGLISVVLSTYCVLGITFPYNPYTPRAPKVNRPQEREVCPSYDIYYEGENLVVILQKDACEMIIDKYGIQNNVVVDGKTSGPQNQRMSYVPLLQFRHLSPLCPHLPYEYRGLKVTVQTTPNCQLTFAVKEFYEQKPHSSQPVLVAKPVVDF